MSDTELPALNLSQLVKAAHEKNNYDELLELTPYAKLLGIECLRLGDDMVFRIPADSAESWADSRADSILSSGVLSQAAMVMVAASSRA